MRWARASYGAVHDFLTNPAYAGAFVFGRTRQEKRLDEQGEVRVRTVEVPIEEWSVCLPEHHPEEILGTHRRPLIADVATLAACIDECAACAATCTICADACLAEPDIAALARCIRLCLDCADACVDAGRILSRQTDPDADTQLTALKACLTACRACAAECERHAHHHEHCRLSAEECRRCERACDDLLAALGGA